MGWFLWIWCAFVLAGSSYIDSRPRTLREWAELIIPALAWPVLFGVMLYKDWKARRR